MFGRLAVADLDATGGPELVLGTPVGFAVLAGRGCAAGCGAGAPGPTGGLLAVKSPSMLDVSLVWDPRDGAGDGDNVSYVPGKWLLPACASCPGSSLVPGCQPTGFGRTSCSHAGAVPGAARDALYYNVRAVCGGIESGS